MGSNNQIYDSKVEYGPRGKPDGKAVKKQVWLQKGFSDEAGF